MHGPSTPAGISGKVQLIRGHETVKKLRSHEMLVNQRNRVNPVADTAALKNLCRFYRSRITGTLEPDGTGVWPHGALVL